MKPPAPVTNAHGFIAFDILTSPSQTCGVHTARYGGRWRPQAPRGSSPIVRGLRAPGDANEAALRKWKRACELVPDVLTRRRVICCAGRYSPKLDIRVRKWPRPWLPPVAGRSRWPKRSDLYRFRVCIAEHGRERRVRSVPRLCRNIPEPLAPGPRCKWHSGAA
jgi:hypothetical protein